MESISTSISIIMQTNSAYDSSSELQML